MKSLFPVVFLLLSVSTFSSCVNAENLQAWSHYAYLNEAYNLSCHDKKINWTLGPQITWKRNDVRITNDKTFHLFPYDGVDDAILQIENVTEHMKGFYMCYAKYDNDDIQVVLRSINLGPYHPHHDKFDRYRDDVVRGVITSAVFMAVIVGMGLMITYRYLTEDQLEKRRKRKEAMRAKLDTNYYGDINLGFQNTGM